MERFDLHNHNWECNLGCNLTFVRMVEGHLNRLRMARGYLYLRDVYEALGLTCNLDVIRKKHLNDILWTKNENFVIEITPVGDDLCSMELEFLNGIDYSKD